MRLGNSAERRLSLLFNFNNRSLNRCCDKEVVRFKILIIEKRVIELLNEKVKCVQKLSKIS